jgi:hypothetical protein
MTVSQNKQEAGIQIDMKAEQPLSNYSKKCEGNMVRHKRSQAYSPERLYMQNKIL